jgi:hypothetical protein
MNLETLVITRTIKAPGGEETIKGIFRTHDSPETDTAVVAADAMGAIKLMDTVSGKAASGLAENFNLPDETEKTEKPKESNPPEENTITCEECGSTINSNESRLSQIFTNKNLCRHCLGKVEK